MYLRILKKDIKRKKTMNVILLLFVILSAMFAASSVNNIVTVMNGIDYFFDKAGMTDFYYATQGAEAEKTVEQFLKDNKNVSDYGSEQVLFISSDNVKRGNKKVYDFSNIGILMSADDMCIKLFDENNEQLKTVEKGKIYISGAIMRRAELETGDKIKVTTDNVTNEFEFAGYIKDALLGSQMMNNPRFIISGEDFKDYADDEILGVYNTGRLFYINSSDQKAFEQDSAEIADGLLFNFTNSMARMTYMMDMLIAAILLVLSAGLIVVSFVVLRFTIGFTISEEFREIGVMKAVGLRNSSIRSLYLVKYAGIAVVGAVIGYFASIPFGNMLLSSVSRDMVLGNDNSVLIGIVCCIAVVLIVMLFCWSCTRKIKKLSPIDAVRNGQTGERFKKRGVMSLHKSRLGSTGFMVLNDILSAPKQFGMITLIFTISTLIAMILSVTASTLKSDSLLYLLTVEESDVYINDTARGMNVIGGVESIEETNREIEQILEENDMPGDVHLEAWYKLPVEFDGKTNTMTFIHCKDTDTTAYEYSEGKAPMYENEIALTKIAADKIGCKLGDTVKITVNGRQEEFVLTAYFQCFNNLGNLGRLHQDVDLSNDTISSVFAYQIKFDDEPDKNVINDRIEQLKDIFDTENVFDSTGFVNDCMGVADTMNTVSQLVLILSLIIIILISVLMERSFITREKSEIALMKAIGFRSSSVCALQTARFAVVVIVAQAISAALCIPLTSLIIDPVFATMGAVGKIDYQIDPKQIFLFYPSVILAASTLSAFLTALYTRTIKASDTSNIE